MRIAGRNMLATVCLSMSMAAGAAENNVPGPRAAPASASAQLDRELAAVAADPLHGMASLSVLAVKDGKVAYQGAFGHRTIDPLDPLDPALNKPATPDTLYRIASVSKFVTMLGGGYPAWGHLGEAYGLLSMFALNLEAKSGVVVLIGGTVNDPETTPGVYSALTRQEERVLSAVHRLVLRPALRPARHRRAGG